MRKDGIDNLRADGPSFECALFEYKTSDRSSVEEAQH
ncbi:hypothetical protein ACVIW0_006237 [Bradyrhizobium sp. USDA 4454]